MRTSNAARQAALIPPPAPPAWVRFATIEPAVSKWLDANPENSFAVSLRAAVLRYGSLTARQLEAVQRCIARDARPAAVGVSVDVSRIVAALEKAAAAGLKWPCLRLDEYRFSIAGPNSRNAGAVYVKAGADYLGKVAGGILSPSFKCTSEQSAAIAALARDPAKSAAAHGAMTGRCACCGLPLSTKASVERGIGPICAEKFGF